MNEEKPEKWSNLNDNLQMLEPIKRAGSNSFKLETAR
jgi:hypothetical protein